jgi:hypothetical protein
MGTTTPKQASTTIRVISPILPIRRALPGNPDDIERCYPALGGACKRSIHEADGEFDKEQRDVKTGLGIPSAPLGIDAVGQVAFFTAARSRMTKRSTAVGPRQTC